MEADVVENFSGLSFPSALMTVGVDVLAEHEEIDRVRQLLAIGNSYLFKKNAELAVKYFSEALEIDNENCQVLMARAHAYIALERFEEALADAHTLMHPSSKLSPVESELQGLQIIAIARENNNEHDLALENYLKIFLKDSSFAGVQQSIIRSATTLANVPSVITRTLNGETFIDVLVRLAQFMFDKNHLKAAQRIIESLLHQEDTISDQILATVLLTGARILMSLQEYEKAVNTYQQCIIRAWKHGLLGVETQSRLELAGVFFDQSQFFDASCCYEKLLCLLDMLHRDRDENSFSSEWILQQKFLSLERICQCFLELSELALAESNCRSFKTLLDDEYVADHGLEETEIHRLLSRQHELSARILWKSGRISDALDCSLAFLHQERLLNSRLYSALYLSGVLSRKKSDLTAAKRFFEECVSIALNDSKRLEETVKALFQIAKIHIANNEIDKASQILQDCIKQSKTFPCRTAECKSLLLLAVCHAAKEENSRAVYHLETTLTFEKEIPPSLYRVCQVRTAIAMQYIGTETELKRVKTMLQSLLPLCEAMALQRFMCDMSFDSKEFRLFSDASDAFVHILGKLKEYKASLVASESLKRFKCFAYCSQKSNLLAPRFRAYVKRIEMPVSFSDVLMSVKTFEAPVLYFHITKSYMYTWVISPTKGLIQFHHHSKETARATIMELLIEFSEKFASGNNGLYNFENRVILKSGTFVSLKKAEDSDCSTVLRDLYHYVVEPLTPSLSSLKSFSNFIIVADGPLNLIPIGDFLSDSLKTLIGKSPGMQVVQSLELLTWICWLESGQAELPPVLATTDTGTLGVTFSRKDQPIVVPSFGTAYLFPGSNMIPEKELQELPVLMFRRQIQSAGGDASDLGSLYKDRMTTDLYPIGSAAVDTSSLPTDASSVKHQADNNSSDKTGATVDGSVTDIISSSEINSKKVEGSFSSIISKTWNSKTVATSKIAAKQYDPKHENEVFYFIGAPLLPEFVNFETFSWKPLKILQHAQAELKLCSQFFKTTAIMGELCSKKEALSILESSTCLHISTYMDYERCTLAFTPDSQYRDLKTIKDGAACISVRDLLHLDLSNIKLLVLSSFPSQKHASPDYMNLLILLVSLGVTSIVYSTQAVSVDASSKFYTYFYRAIKKFAPSCSVTRALSYAKSHMKKDVKLCKPQNWQSFQLFGKDSFLNGSAMIHDMLDHIVDHVEGSRECDPLNVKQEEPLNQKDLLKKFRELIADIVLSKIYNFDVIESIYNLLLKAAQTLNIQNETELVRLHDDVILQDDKVLSLLHLLKFDFQPYGTTLNNPVVLLPHWDKDDVLMVVTDVFRNLLALRDSFSVLEELVHVLRSASKDEESASALIDILSLSEHAPEVQLQITDTGVQKAWISAPSRRLLQAIGFHQVGVALLSYRTLQNIRYQQSTFTILCALSGVKGDAMLNKVDTGYLGKTGSDQLAGDDISVVSGPNDQVVIPIQWRIDTDATLLSSRQTKELSESVDAVKIVYKQQLSSFVKKHREQLEGHGDEYLDETFGISPVRLDKVKVEAGGTPSMTRAPLGLPSPPLNIEQVEQRREYANYLYNYRKEEIKFYERAEIRDLLTKPKIEL